MKRSNEHIFLSCEYSKRLWENVRDWVNKEQDLPNVNPKNVIIGFVEDNSGSVVKNLLVLLYQRYIYNNKISKSPLRFYGFKMFVKCFMKMEEKTALKTDDPVNIFRSRTFLQNLCKMT